MKIQESLVAIQSQLKAPKDLQNSFGNYRYRSAESILEAVKPLLEKQGLILTISDDIICLGNESQMTSEKIVDPKGKVSILRSGGVRFYVKATATLSNGEESISTTAFARESDNKAGMDESQITGATSSYARKYALNGLFCIDDTKDADATNTHGKESVPQVDLTQSGKDTKWMTSQTRQVIMDLKKKYKITDDGFRDRVNDIYNTSFEGLTEVEALDLIKKMTERFGK